MGRHYSRRHKPQRIVCGHVAMGLSSDIQFNFAIEKEKRKRMITNENNEWNCRSEFYRSPVSDSHNQMNSTIFNLFSFEMSTNFLVFDAVVVAKDTKTHFTKRRRTI